MFTVQCYNNISAKGLERLPQSLYQLSNTDPDAILVRSHDLNHMIVTPKLKAIARAGAGTNNIPIEKLKASGIPVFNTPGANANAVKELVIASLFLTSRNLCQAWQTTKKLTGNDVAAQVEQLKKQFSGTELPGKTLGILGLGAIGVQVANAAQSLGMKVVAYDPFITIENAWQLSATVKQCHHLDELLTELDFLSIHIPYNDSTHDLMNAERLQRLRPSCVVLNFSRAAIVNADAIIELLNSNKLSTYVTDFPNEKLLSSNKVLALPHLGASTTEAEQNCAMMAVDTLRAFLEHGNIRHSVNFPNIQLTRNKGQRVTIINQNIPNMLSQISQVFAKQQLNIIDMINKSKEDIAYTILDVEGAVKTEHLQQLSAIEGVIKCRAIP